MLIRFNATISTSIIAFVGRYSILNYSQPIQEKYVKKKSQSKIIGKTLQFINHRRILKTYNKRNVYVSRFTTREYSSVCNNLASSSSFCSLYLIL